MKTLSRLLAGVLGVLVGALVGACTSAPAVPASCQSSRECAGLVCDPATMTCVECLATADCLGAGSVCLGQHCRSIVHCASSRECSGLVCDMTLGYCVDCLTDVDCPMGELCRGSACVVPSSGDAGHAPNDTGGVDAATPADGGTTPDDAGIDASVPPDDASVPDAFVPDDVGIDGGFDSGPPDAGTLACSTPGATEMVACGTMCGTQTRLCTAAHVWTFVTSCMDHGVCEAGNTRTSSCAGTPTTDHCDASCEWVSSCAVDVVVMLDVTASLASFVLSSSAKSALSSALIAPLLTSTSADVHVGLAYFSDAATSPYGATTDIPFGMQVAPTASMSALTSGLDAIPTTLLGGDTEEGGVIGLYELGGATSGLPNIVRPTCPAGTEGAGCFRTGARRAIVVVSDAIFHNAPTSTVAYGLAGAPSWASTSTRLTGASIDVFAIGIGSNATMWSMIEASLGSTSARVDTSTTTLASTTAPWSSVYASIFAKLRSDYAL